MRTLGLLLSLQSPQARCLVTLKDMNPIQRALNRRMRIVPARQSISSQRRSNPDRDAHTLSLALCLALATR